MGIFGSSEMGGKMGGLAAYGEPGRSLCQDVALHLDLAQLPTQPHQFFPLGGGQAFLPGQRLALIDGGLANPVGDGLGRDTELTRELRRRAAGSNQLDHLLAEFCRVRRSYFGHLRLLEHKQ